MQSQSQPELELERGTAPNRNSAELQPKKMIVDPWDYSDDPTNVAAFLAEQDTLLQKQEISLAELLSRVSGLVEEIQVRLNSYSANLEEYRWKLATTSQLPQPALASGYFGIQSGAYFSNQQLALTPPPDPVSTIGTGVGLGSSCQAQILEQGQPPLVVDLPTYRAASRVRVNHQLRLRLR